MKTNKIFETTNRYFDNDLSKEEEIYLFSLLSTDDKARDDFKAMNILRESTKKSKEDFTFELDSKVFNSSVINEERRKLFTFHLPTVIGYAFSVILLIGLLLTYNQSSEYKKDNTMKSQQISDYQNIEEDYISLQLEYNRLSAAKNIISIEAKTINEERNLIKSKYERLENKLREQEILMMEAKTVLPCDYRMDANYLSSVENIPTIKLTKDDYLTQ